MRPGDSFPSGPPAHEFFRQLSGRALGQVSIRDHASVAYVGDLLTRFVSTEELYPVVATHGRRLEYLSDLLLEAHRAPSAAVRRDRFRHLGDLTLFTLGVFPERFRRPRQAMMREFYRLQGRSSYRTVAGLVRDPAALGVFRKLATQYDQYVEGLGWIRRYIRDPFYQYMFRQFGVS